MCSETQHGDGRLQAINYVCVRAYDDRVRRSVGSSVAKRSNVLHGSNDVHKAPVLRKSKMGRDAVVCIMNE